MGAPRQGSEEHLSELAENIREVFWVFTADLADALYANRAYEEIFGRTRESLYQDSGTFLQAVHPEDRRRVSKRLRLARTGEQTLECRIVRPDGEVRWLRIRGFPVREASRVVGVAEDITERRQAEQMQHFLAEAGEILASSLELEETLQHVARLAVQQAADWAAVFVVDEPTGEVRRVELAHGDPDMEGLVQRLRSIPPHPRHPIRQVIGNGHPLLLESIPDTLADALAEDPADRELVRGLDVKSAMGVPLVAGGRVLGALYFAAAESGRRYGADDLAVAEELAHLCALAMENARLYEQARQALRTREQVMALVSHDLRNPLQAITLTTAALSQHALAPEELHDLQIIDRATEQMDRLIQDLLDIARVEAGDLPLRPATFPAAAVVREVAELFLARARERRLRLTWDAPDGLLVHADPDRLMQVLSNLVGNAVKFTPRGGEIAIRAVPAGDDFHLEVTDTGIGIPDDELPLIFERFWQARPNGRESVGIGLAIARGIVRAHGGEIHARSTPGRGTTFRCVLPRNLPASEPEPRLRSG
jgi:PAS domain S-box-containing protein